MLYPKESDCTNIKCNICENKITYEYVSFNSYKCSHNNLHYTQYAIKCSKCNKSYGPWKEFNKKLFPGYNIDKCPCYTQFKCTCNAYNNIFKIKCKVCRYIDSIEEIDEIYAKPQGLAYPNKLKNKSKCSIFYRIFQCFINNSNKCID